MNKYIGIPFDVKNCYNLVQLYYKNELGIELPETSVNPLNTKRSFLEYLKQIESYWITIKEPEKDCVVAMSYDIKYPQMIQHFGIYLGNNKVLHTLNKINSHIVSLDSLKPFIKGYYKWQ